MIRSDAAVSISRFSELIGVPRRTYTWRLARHRAGDPVRGPWPAPVRGPDRAARGEVRERLAGVGGIAGSTRCSTSTATTSVPRRQCCGRWLAVTCCSRSRSRLSVASSPRLDGRRSSTLHRLVGTGCGRRTSPLLRLRPRARGSSAVSPTTSRSSPLPVRVTATQTAPDLCAAFDAAEAAVEALLGISLFDDCVDHVTGEIFPVVIVTDNGPATKSVSVAKWFAAPAALRARPHTAPVTAHERGDRTLVPIAQVRAALPPRHRRLS